MSGSEENSEAMTERLLEEAQLYPDRRTETEHRLWVLEPMYEQAGVLEIEEPKALVLGAGKGADLLALKRLNPKTTFIDAVDSYPPEKPHNIVDEKGETLATTVEEEVVSYLGNDKNKQRISQANLIVGTRLGPSTIAHAIDELPDNGEYLAVFTTDAKGEQLDQIFSKISNKNLVHDNYDITSGNETVFRVSPNTETNKYKDILLKAAAA